MEDSWCLWTLFDSHSDPGGLYGETETTLSVLLNLCPTRSSQDVLVTP